CSSCADTNVLF
nr:immunoglobulin light chain junction region [Macaca mulatta]